MRLVQAIKEFVNKKQATKLLEEADQIIIVLEKEGKSVKYFKLYREVVKNGKPILYELLVEDCPIYSDGVYKLSVFGGSLELLQSIVDNYRIASELLEKTYVL